MTIHSLNLLGPAALVRATAPRLAAQHCGAAADLMNRLADHAPALSDHPATTRALIEQIATLAPTLDCHDTDHAALRDALCPLAAQLRDHGLTPRGYIALRAAFLDTIARILGPDPALLSAWDAAVAPMLTTMMLAAYGPQRRTNPLAA